MGYTFAPTSGHQWEEPVPQQLSLTLDPALTTQHRSLKDCIAARIYQQRGGVTSVAGRLDMSPSHLSEVLGGGGDRKRKFDLDELERYIACYGDVTPILYLVAKYLPEQGAEQRAALDRVQALLIELPNLLVTAGVQSTKGKRR